MFGENEQGVIWRPLESSPEVPVCSASSAVSIRRKRVMEEALSYWNAHLLDSDEFKGLRIVVLYLKTEFDGLFYAY